MALLDVAGSRIEVPVGEQDLDAPRGPRQLESMLARVRESSGPDAATSLAAHQLFSLEARGPNGESVPRSRGRLEALDAALPEGYVASLGRVPGMRARLAAFGAPDAPGGPNPHWTEASHPEVVERDGRGLRNTMARQQLGGASSQDVLLAALTNPVAAVTAPGLAERLTPAQWMALEHTLTDGPLVNLTPHVITIIDEDNRAIREYPSAGLARAAQSDEPLGSVTVDGVELPVVRTVYGASEFRPSRPTAEALAEVATEAMAAQLHEQWREQRRAQVVAEAVAAGRDPSTLTEADFARIKDDGNGGEVDIFHTPFGELPPKWQQENRDAARAAVAALDRLDVAAPSAALEAAAASIHEQWVERNPWADDALKVPYAQLPEVEKAKDREQARVALEALAEAGAQRHRLDPEPLVLEPGTRYVVSAITAQAAVNAGLPREQLVLTDTPVYDDDRRIIGVRQFATAPEPAATTAGGSAIPAGTTFVNLTPRPLEFYEADGQGGHRHVHTLDVGGPMAKASTTKSPVGGVHDVGQVAVGFGAPEDLPEPQDGVVYVVNIQTVWAARRVQPDRNDLLVTSGTVRNDQGQIVGVTGFAVP